MAKIIRVKTHRPDLDELAEAILEKDGAAIGRELDEMLEFHGPAGVVLEQIDGAAFAALADFLIDHGPELAERIVERAKARKKA